MKKKYIVYGTVTTNPAEEVMECVDESLYTLVIKLRSVKKSSALIGYNPLIGSNGRWQIVWDDQIVTSCESQNDAIRFCQDGYPS